MTLLHMLWQLDLKDWDIRVNGKPIVQYNVEELPLDEVVFFYHCDREHGIICITTFGKKEA